MFRTPGEFLFHRNKGRRMAKKHKNLIVQQTPALLQEHHNLNRNNDSPKPNLPRRAVSKKIVIYQPILANGMDENNDVNEQLRNKFSPPLPQGYYAYSSDSSQPQPPDHYKMAEKIPAGDCVAKDALKGSPKSSQMRHSLGRLNSRPNDKTLRLQNEQPDSMAVNATSVNCSGCQMQLSNNKKTIQLNDDVEKL